MHITEPKKKLNNEFSAQENATSYILNPIYSLMFQAAKLFLSAVRKSTFPWL